MITAPRPRMDEYAPAFAGYVARIGEGEEIVAVLAKQLDQVLDLIERLGHRGDYRYAPGKWSVKELVGHLSDTERVFAYRALHIARGDSSPLESFEEDDYVAEQRAGDRTLADLTSEWSVVRRATLALLQNLPPAAWARRGSVGGHSTSVRALTYVIAGHTRHHLEVLEARYTG
jgi:hypothetical protein